MMGVVTYGQRYKQDVPSEESLTARNMCLLKCLNLDIWGVWSLLRQVHLSFQSYCYEYHGFAHNNRALHLAGKG